MSIKNDIANTPVRKAFLKLSSANVWMFVFQLISLYIMTMYYSKAQIAEFSIFTVLTFLCSKLANLKLFDAIIREPDSKTSNEIFSSSISLACYGSVIIGLGLYLCSVLGIHMNLMFYGASGYVVLVLLIVIHLLTSSVTPVISSGLLKKEALTILTRGRIIKAMIQVIVLLILLNQANLNGLIIALVLSGLIQVLFYVFSNTQLNYTLVSFKTLYQTIVQNKDILIYTLPTSILLSLRENGIVQIIQMSFGESALAAYAIADRILRLPSVIFGSAATETLYKYGSDTFYKLSKATFLKQLLRGVKRFTVFYLVLAIICAVLAYPLLTLLFGDKWLITSEILFYYSLWIVPFSIVAMIRNIPVMLKQQRTYFILEVVLFLVVTIGLFFLSRNASFEEAMFFKFFVEALLMIVIVLAIFNLVKTQVDKEPT